MPIHPRAHSVRPPRCVRYVSYALLSHSKNVCCEQGTHIKENPFIQIQQKHPLMISIPCSTIRRGSNAIKLAWIPASHSQRNLWLKQRKKDWTPLLGNNLEWSLDAHVLFAVLNREVQKDNFWERKMLLTKCLLKELTFFWGKYSWWTLIIENWQVCTLPNYRRLLSLLSQFLAH